MVQAFKCEVNMSYSYTSTETATFTLTHAKYLSAKVTTDLKRMQRFYGFPSDLKIDQFESELTQLLKHGYLEKVYYGFKRNEDWIEPTLMYTASELNITTNDDPGKIRPGKNISDAVFYSFLEYSSTWNLLSDEERYSFDNNLPFQRGTAKTPGINGYLDDDRTYSSGGRALSRSSVRSYT